MNVMSSSEIELERWKARLARSHDRLEDLLAALGEGEHDWAPDEGIATVRDHVWSIMAGERSLSGRLTRGSSAAPSAGGYGPADVELDEMVRILRICHRNLANWLESATTEDVARAAADDAGLTDLLFDHLETKARHSASIAALIRLIDPARLPASEDR